jgi:DNA-binding response OmpR family regulator
VQSIPDRIPKTILVVEDEAILAENIRAVLHYDNFLVLHSTTAQDAISKLRNQELALVILDINLEVGSGDKVVQYMREGPDKLNQRTPVILTSGHLNRPLIEQIGKFVQGAFVKPFSLEDLLAKVKSLTA